MQITVEPGDQHTVLHLRGEFDTYYCPHLQEEIDELVKAGANRVALNLRLVKFINSTALGAIIKASKTLKAAGGKLVISRPSPFCRDILSKVGLDRVVPVVDSDEAAIAALLEGTTATAAGDDSALDDAGSVLFGLVDGDRVEHFLPVAKRGPATNPVHGHAFGSTWRGVGRMSSLDTEGLYFLWNGGQTTLTPFEMGQLLSLGTELVVKFRLPLLRKGHCEATVTISEVDERADGVKLGASFQSIDAETRKAVEQYSQDLAFLKKELRQATGE
ncbi:MAG: STAS domain-containing protein [Planctomycetota bacterium]